MLNKTNWYLLALLATTLIGCGGSDNDSDNPQESNTAAVKIMPVSATSPTLSILVDENLEDEEEGAKLSDLALGQAVAFGRVPGTNNFDVRYVLPEGPALSVEYERAQAPFDLEIEGDIRYEIYVGGEYPDGEHWVVEVPLTYEEDETQARLTLVNASPSMSAIDIHLTDVDAPIDSSTLLASLDYKESDNTIRVDPGDYQIQITEANSTTVIYTSAELTLGTQTDLSLVSLDNPWIKEGLTGKPPILLSRSTSSGSSSLFPAVDAGADLRVVHASPDAGLLDIILNEDFNTPFAEDLALGEVTPYQTIDSGVNNVSTVHANSAAGGELLDDNFNFGNGVSWTMFVMRPLADIDPLFISENAREIAAYSRFRVVHGASEAGDLDIYITEEGADLAEEDAEGDPVYSPLGTNLGLKGASGYVSIEEGTYDITFTRTVAEGDTPPATPEVIYQTTAAFVKGEVYTLLLRDEEDLSTTHNWLDSDPTVAP